MSWKPLACHGCDPSGGGRDRRLTWLPFWENSDPSSGHPWMLICHDLGQAIKLASASSFLSVKQLNSSSPEGRSWPVWVEGERRRLVWCARSVIISLRDFLTYFSLLICFTISDSFCFSLLLISFVSVVQGLSVASLAEMHSLSLPAFTTSPNAKVAGTPVECCRCWMLLLASGWPQENCPPPFLSLGSSASSWAALQPLPSGCPKGPFGESAGGTKLLGWEVPVPVARSTTILVLRHSLSPLRGWIIRNWLYIQLCILESKLG